MREKLIFLPSWKVKNKMELSFFGEDVVKQILSLSFSTHREWCDLREVCKLFQKIVETIFIPFPRTIYAYYVPYDGKKHDLLIRVKKLCEDEKLCEEEFTFVSGTYERANNFYDYGVLLLKCETNEFCVPSKTELSITHSHFPGENEILTMENEGSLLFKYKFDIKDLIFKKEIVVG